MQAKIQRMPQKELRASKNIVDVELSSVYSIGRGEGGTPCPMDKKPTPNNLL